MGIDRSDEDDTPDIPRSSPTVERDTSATVDHDTIDDSEAAQAAYNVEYRAIVEAEYRAPYDAWEKVVPALQEAWAEHERTYPRPERSRPTLDQDGSWHGDGDLELNPAQNADATEGCAEIKEQAKDDILPAIRRVEAEDTGRELVGLEHWIKGEDRLKEKIADRLRLSPELTVGQALTEIPDAVRFTFAYSEKRYASGVLADVDRLKSEGFELIKLKNSWSSDQYKGINSQWRRPESGLRVEVQFHTQASFEAKQLTHKAYERLRSPLTSEDEEQALESYQRAACVNIPGVPGADGIENYRPERPNG